MVKYIVACITANNINKEDGHRINQEDKSKMEIGRYLGEIWEIVGVIE